MKNSVRFAVAAALSLAAFADAASATTQLIAVGSLANLPDLSGLTGTLENGNAANILGGLGSGLTYAGGNTFLALPDRGPNAVAWNSAVDNTTSYISRFQTINMDLVANTSGTGLAYNLTPTLTGTTLLYSTTALNYGTNNATPNTAGLGDTTGKYYFTGRSDAFATGSSSLNANDARLDPEAIRMSNDGKSVFISDEYGPYVRQFDRATGQLIKTFDLPSEYGVANKSSIGGSIASGTGEIGLNTSGRVANKGMEGLAISPDGKTLVGFMQSPLAQDGGDGGQYNRIIKIDIATGATTQYVYDNLIGTKTYNSSELIAVNDHQFLVLERDGKGLGDSSTAVIKKVFLIDLASATPLPTDPITGNSTKTGASNIASYAVSKTEYLDLRTAIGAIVGNDYTKIPAKLEGLAFGQDVVVGGTLMHTLYVANDNDFVPNIAGTNNFYVFAFDNTAGGLSTYTAQALDASPVPLPGAAWLMLGGLGALAALRRRRVAAVADNA